jgi:hypothetical protein
LPTKGYAPEMQVEDLEIVLDSHVTDEKQSTKMPFSQK